MSCDKFFNHPYSNKQQKIELRNLWQSLCTFYSKLFSLARLLFEVNEMSLHLSHRFKCFLIARSWKNTLQNAYNVHLMVWRLIETCFERIFFTENSDNGMVWNVYRFPIVNDQFSNLILPVHGRFNSHTHSMTTSNFFHVIFRHKRPRFRSTRFVRRSLIID